MKSFTHKTTVYRKCERVYNKLIQSEHKEISKNTLRRLISKYCVGSQKMIDEYVRRFVEFGFLKPTKTDNFQVNHKNIFFSDEDDKRTILSSNKKENQSQNNLTINSPDVSSFNNKLDGKNFQSKTLVYPEDVGPRVPFSVKVKKLSLIHI